MSFGERLSLFFLRVSLGWLFFYAGITKVLDPSWSAAEYIRGAKMFGELYAFFLRPDILPWVDIANKWGLTLLGASLILGLFVRYSAPLGILLVALYYFAALQYPYPNPKSYIVDEHVIYALALLVLWVFRADRAFGAGK